LAPGYFKLEHPDIISVSFLSFWAQGADFATLIAISLDIPWARLIVLLL
jgi:hypothetical protein